MKKIILVAVFLHASFGINYSQNFKLTDISGNDVTNGSITYEFNQQQLSDFTSEEVTDVFFQNLTNDTLAIKVRRITENIVDSSENLLCWLQCYGPAVSLSPTALTVNPQATLDNFKSHFRPYKKYGTSTFRFVFFNVANPNDTVSVRIIYTTGTLGTSKLIKNSSFSIYPNPSNNLLNVSINSTVPKEIKITNILGTVVKTQSLGKLENSVAIKTEDLEEGVYFVSVVNNGKIENSKRLVVKH